MVGFTAFDWTPGIENFHQKYVGLLRIYKAQYLLRGHKAE